MLITFIIHTLSNQLNLALVSFSTIAILQCIFKDQNNTFLTSSSNAIIIIYAIPLIVPILSWIHFMIQRQRKLSPILDMNENTLRCKSRSQLPPYPDQTQSGNKSRTSKKNAKDIPTKGWALVTGASRGIGRAIAVELARYQIPVILVARNHSKLLEVSKLLQEYYNVPTKILVSDFSKYDAAEELWKNIQDFKVKDKLLEIDVLIHNAGIGDTNNLVEMNAKTIQDIITVNTLTGSKLCQMLGKEMKERRRGRIVLISSVSGLSSGVPTASIYAATKAFQKSLAVSMGLELEPYGVGVTSVMPGGVHDTGFATESNMESDAIIWNLPFGRLSSSIVASSTIEAMIIGSPEIVVGWLYVLSCKFIFPLMPERLIAMACGLMWNPPPFLKK